MSESTKDPMSPLSPEPSMAWGGDRAASRDAAPPGLAPRDGRLCFLHVPKAGGTSIAAYFEKFFHIGEIGILLSPVDLQRTPLSELRGVRLLRSHAIRTAFDLFSARFRTVSFVRDPVERALSHFKHLRTLSQALPDYRMFAGMDLRGFLASENGRAEIMNVQCSLYGIEGSVAAPLLVNPHGWRRSTLMERLGSRAMLDDALAFLERVGYVGTIEHWTRRATALCMDMNWPLPDPADLQRLNQAATDLGEVPKRELKEIERLVTLDRELYETVRAREAEAARQDEERIEEATTRYKASAERNRSSYYWNFEAGLMGGGLYQRESVVVKSSFGKESFGTTHAGRLIYSYWAGEDMFFDVWLEPGRSYRLRALTDFLRGFEPDKAELSVNGAVVERAAWQSIFGCEMMIDVAIPPDRLKGGNFARVRLRCPGQGRRPPGDSRLLGIHFQWIEIVPDA